MSWRFLVVVSIAGSLTAISASQRSSSKWWEAEPTRTELGLSDEDSARIEAIFQETLPTLRATGRELRHLEQDLSDLVADETATEADVEAQIDLVEATRSRLNKARTLMAFKMHRALSAEQRVKLREIERRRRDREHEK